MKKLEEKHITPYIPYKLKWRPKGGSTFSQMVMKGYVPNRIVGPYDEDDEEILESIDLTYTEAGRSLPVMRPLSDLVKMVDHKGEMFLYWETFGLSSDIEEKLKYIGEGGEPILVYDLPYEAMELLFEHHFDVFDLIKNGFAIDINTLK